MNKLNAKKVLWVCLFLLPITMMMGQNNPFVTIWKPTNASSTIGGQQSGNQAIYFPGIGTGYTIYWEEIGKETTHNATLTNQTSSMGNPLLIDFGAPQGGGEYRVKVLPTGFNAIRFISENWDTLGDVQKIIDIAQWGDVAWNSMFLAFAECSNLTLSATAAANLSAVTNMMGMFYNATSFNGAINHWDVSNVTDMEGMFYNATSFNQPLNSWNVGNVTNMSYMFYNATAFNQPLDSWNVGNVTKMRRMFLSATSFNQPLGSWNVGSVTNMSDMFADATSFNQPLNSWNVGNVTNMSYMFFGATAFDQPLSSWNVSNVTDMSSMFVDATSFNQPLDNWNVGNVTDMSYMLDNCGMSCQNYDSTLIGWAALPTLQGNVELGAAGRSYTCPAAVAARNTLTSTHSWTINGDSHDGYCYQVERPECFVTVWKPTNASSTIGGQQSGNQAIYFPGIGTGYTIYWEEIGKETTHHATLTNQTSSMGNPLLIDFGAPQGGGEYRVKVLPTGFNAIRFISENWETLGDVQKIIDIAQWGDVAWNSMFFAFAKCSNLTLSATDAPNLSAVTDMSWMFSGATAFNGAINH